LLKNYYCLLSLEKLENLSDIVKYLKICYNIIIMANMEIIVCKSGRQGGCGSELADPADMQKFEEKQLSLGNVVIDRVFCNQQMCSPINANLDSLNRYRDLGFEVVTGVLVSGVTKSDVKHNKSPGVVLKSPEGFLKSELF
jgi:hypothetical protein